MILSVKRLAVAASSVLLGAVAFAAHAESSASSASSGTSASVGSVSDSLTNSSDASSRSSNNGKRLAAGDYRVIDIVMVAERPGFARMTLQALAGPGGDDGRFFLELPHQALDQERVASGQTVAARERPYGFEFAIRRADAEPLRAFFIVLADDWYRELQTNAVVL